jgi:hypothetical protein
MDRTDSFRWIRTEKPSLRNLKAVWHYHQISQLCLNLTPYHVPPRQILCFKGFVSLITCHLSSFFGIVNLISSRGVYFTAIVSETGTAIHLKPLPSRDHRHQQGHRINHPHLLKMEVRRHHHGPLVRQQTLIRIRIRPTRSIGHLFVLTPT